MLTALFADIHGNREAFAACLEHAERLAVERMIFLGDYVGYGADPGWVVDEVMARVANGARAIVGNHDAALWDTSMRMNPVAEEAIAWTRSRLDERQREFLRGLPLSFEEDDRLFVHANAWAPGRWGYVLGPLDAVRSMRATAAGKTFCGHVHVPALYHMTAVGKLGEFTPKAGTDIPLLARWRWLAVIGSVGQPRDDNPAACYALFDDARDTLTYVRVAYDIFTAAEKILDAGLPPMLAARLARGA
jgi:diadenosine tetraphosphatase ApaH/serine/threonine PP2A family protein phosphatase